MNGALIWQLKCALAVYQSSHFYACFLCNCLCCIMFCIQHLILKLLSVPVFLEKMIFSESHFNNLIVSTPDVTVSTESVPKLSESLSANKKLKFETGACGVKI